MIHVHQKHKMKGVKISKLKKKEKSWPLIIHIFMLDNLSFFNYVFYLKLEEWFLVRINKYFFCLTKPANNFYIKKFSRGRKIKAFLLTEWPWLLFKELKFTLFDEILPTTVLMTISYPSVRLCFTITVNKLQKYWDKYTQVMKYHTDFNILLYIIVTERKWNFLSHINVERRLESVLKTHSLDQIWKSYNFFNASTANSMVMGGRLRDIPSNLILI